MSYIKPCPFCGTQPDYDDANHMNVECPSCGITGPAGIHIGKESAIEAWNARAAVQANVPDGMVLVNAGALNMIINVLRRDADEGRTVRGEMADEILLSAIQKG